MKRLVLLAFVGLMLSGACRAATPEAKPQEEKEGTVAGIAVKRTKEGWLGVALKDGGFQLTFYNGKKIPTPADCSSAVFRWAVHYQPNEERTELLPTGDPAVLASPYTVKPPFAFKLHITLLGGGTEEPEAYLVDFSA